MRSKVFNTTFENMLRLLLLADTLNAPANVDRLAALDFICIYGKKCKVLGFLYSINDRGRQVEQGVQSPYAKAYVVGAKIVCRRFSNYTDEGVLQYISDRATESKEA